MTKPPDRAAFSLRRHCLAAIPLEQGPAP